MPTIDELLKARAARQAQAKAQSVPEAKPNPAPSPAPTSKVEVKAEPKDNLPAYAPALQDRLKSLADEEDYMDVELSAQSLAETMSAVISHFLRQL